MGNTSAADIYHYYTYTVGEDAITQTCAYHAEYSATVTPTIDGDKCWYTGNAVEAVSLQYSGDWEYTAPTLSYENNVDAGTATACVEVGSVTLEKQFIIVDAPTILGGSVRTEAPAGLRFQSKVDEDLAIEGVTFGTLLIPEKELGDNELTKDTSKVNVVKQSVWATKDENDTDYEEGYKYFNAVLTDIPEEHYNKVIVARSYVYANGQYYYSETKARSIMQVASYAIQNNETDDILYTYVEKGLEGKEISIEGAEKIMEGRDFAFSLVGSQGCVAIWSSSNEKVVTVDNTGKVTATGVGTATITATIGSRIKITLEVVVTSGWTGII